MLLLDVLNEAIEKAKSIMTEKNPEIDPNSAEAAQLAKVFTPRPLHCANSEPQQVSRC